jgi:hypothetical protein
VIAPRDTSSPISIERAIRIIVRFQVPIDTFAPRPSGPSAWCGLDDDERRVVLLRNLCRRQPRLLQRGVLAEQRFLQRPSHTISLQPVKFPWPLRLHPWRLSGTLGIAHHFISRDATGRLARYSIITAERYRLDASVNLSSRVSLEARKWHAQATRSGSPSMRCSLTNSKCANQR